MRREWHPLCGPVQRRSDNHNLELSALNFANSVRMFSSFLYTLGLH